MGIFLHVNISKSVQKQEWEKVYEETLQLVKSLPFAERCEAECQGVNTICLVPTQEREEKYGWNHKKTRIGWCADGDYESMHTAESYSLYRNLVEDDEVIPDAGDALMGAIPAYLNYDWNDERFNKVYSIWGNKTQGEPYHIMLLAVACLIEARLGEKAFVYGDITRGQCRKAVELANMYLGKAIDVPDRCDMERLWNRIGKLPFGENEQLILFEKFYLGTKGEEFGQYIRNRYSEKACTEYWMKKFKDSSIGTMGFNEKISEYLLWGFDLENLCRLIKYENKEGEPQYEKFIKRIMDAKLHWKVKNCKDVLDIDQETSEPYSIYTLMAQFVFAGAKNLKVDRYIPIEDIREELRRGLNNKCDVDFIIDEYLEKEAKEEIRISETEMSDEDWERACKQDSSEVFNQIMDLSIQALEEKSEKYDVSTHEQLIFFKKGDTILPALEASVKRSFAFYRSMTEENYYKELMEKPAITRCEWLIGQNRYLLIRDKDWDKVFTDIKENEDSFARYYPMVRVILDSDNLVYMVIAFVLNDELYRYCEENTCGSETAPDGTLSEE